MAKKRVTSGIGAILGTQPSKVDKAVQRVVDEGGELKLTPTFALRPDPDQPRNLLPESLYERLFAGENPTTVMQAWLSQMKQGQLSPLQEKRLISLEGLAHSIATHGLIQPIAIGGLALIEAQMPAGVEKVIIAGERRWWAHVYLYTTHTLIREEREADHIRTVNVLPDSNIRALQFAENVVRESLTAIERARAVLSQREYMSRGKGKLVTWTAVQETMGISKSYRWRILEVLNLSRDAQELVTWYGFTEKAIRPIVSKLKERPDLQIKALEQLAAWQQAEDEESGEKRVSDYVIRLLANESQRVKPEVPSVTQTAQALYKRVGSTLKVMGTLDESELRQIAIIVANDAQAAQSIAALRDKLNQILGEP